MRGIELITIILDKRIDNFFVINFRRKLEERKALEMDQIKLRAKLKAIKEVCDYDESVLNGLSSVIRLLDGEEYRELKESQFLGTIFQAIEFKEDVDVGTLNYFQVRFYIQFYNFILSMNSCCNRFLILNRILLPY